MDQIHTASAGAVLAWQIFAVLMTGVGIVSLFCACVLHTNSVNAPTTVLFTSKLATIFACGVAALLWLDMPIVG